MSFRTVDYEPGCVRLLDQTLLPAEVSYRDCRSVEQLVTAIRELCVRGAPAIGVAAAYGVVLAAELAAAEGHRGPEFLARLRGSMQELRQARPTAVNLGWAIDRLEAVLAGIQREAGDVDLVLAQLTAAAVAIHAEDERLCEALGVHGAELLPAEATVMTHCNAGALATAGIGTALGVVYAAVKAGKKLHVIADETRPLLQGARLTSWELSRQGIPVTVICDGAAGWTMRRRGVDAVIVGADRIAANGDTANKIGTYGLAVLARRHGIPFYVAAPYSTLDLSLATGEEIPIEERDGAEVTHFGGLQVTPDGVEGYNPAFDVTPAELITAIITEHGVFRPPFEESFRRAYARAGAPAGDAADEASAP